MRILLTAQQFLPDFASGTEVLAFQTAKELQRLGHEVRVVTGYPADRPLADAERFDRYVYEDLLVERFHHHERVPMGEQDNIVELEYNNQLFAGWLRRYLREWRPDIIHFFHLKRLSASAIDVGRSLSIPMVMTPTDFWLVCPTVQLLLPDNTLCQGPDRGAVNCFRHAVTNTQPPAVARLFGRAPSALMTAMVSTSGTGLLRGIRPFSWVYALSGRAGFLRQRMNWLDRVMVPTKFMECLLVGHGLSPERARFCRFGIDLAGQITREARRGEETTLRVGFIGTLKAYKGAHVLLEAVRHLGPDCNLKVSIYGGLDETSPYGQGLRRLAGGDPRICFCGTFPNGEIGQVLAELDVLVVPSLWYENTPLVIYSAQAAGCPVIASDLAGMAEVIRHREDGLLFGPGDAQGLADAIRRVARDRGFLGRLAANALRPKSATEYAGEMESVYRELIEERAETK